MLSWLKPALFLSTLLVAVNCFADDHEHGKPPSNPQYQQECGSCHLAFPPRLLHEAAWRKLMHSLDRHFGSDAGLDATTRDTIERFLVANAARRERLDAFGQTTLRITETAWFKHEHDEVGAATWQRASIKHASNCAACHTQAEQGSFSERQIRIPR